MSVMASAINALSTFYPESLDPFDPEAVELATVLILAKTRTITSYVMRASKGEPLLYPDYSRGYVEDFLRMAFAVPYQQWDPNPVAVKALDKLLILHADHEQNCSTSTVRIVGSSHANIYASVAAGINALSGPLHGGANEAVLKMLTEIKRNGGDASDFMRRVKDKEDGVRLMGFGHRVYKNYDPRAAIVKKSAHDVLAALGTQDELLDIAMTLEDIALHDDYFISRKLYPNVDFYTGIIYKAMGFDEQMFTPLFALGRMPGWIAQWREMMLDPQTKIGRPRQIYTGAAERDYVPAEER
jgi:citrate synthase